MVHDDDDNGYFNDLSNREILRILLEEIAGVRLELKDDIASLDRKLSGRIDALDDKLNRKIDNLAFKVDQNQICFMTNLNDIDKRVTVLEVRAA